MAGVPATSESWWTNFDTQTRPSCEGFVNGSGTATNREKVDNRFCHDFRNQRNGKRVRKVRIMVNRL